MKDAGADSVPRVLPQYPSATMEEAFQVKCPNSVVSSYTFA